MKIAVLYTGEVRTLLKTIPYFEEHLLLQNPDAHVFAVLQCKLEERPNIMDVLNHHMNDKLHHLEWFEKDDNLWRELQNRLLSSMQISENWKNYLKNSGSMIEYYQMYLAYQNMVKYEKQNNTRYDFVLRIRPDVIMNKPLDFSYRIENQNIRSHMKRVQVYLGEKVISKKCLSIFMNSLFDNKRYHHIRYEDTEPLLEKYYNDNLEIAKLLDSQEEEDEFYEKLKDFIIHGKYVLSLRKNVVYFMNRNHFDFLPYLGITYGYQRMENNEYWFNAESQFEIICMQKNVAIFNSTTYLEDKSLYEYDDLNYFENSTQNKNTVINDSSFLFFLCRQ